MKHKGKKQRKIISEKTEIIHVSEETSPFIFSILEDKINYSMNKNRMP